MRKQPSVTDLIRRQLDKPGRPDGSARPWYEISLDYLNRREQAARADEEVEEETQQAEKQAEMSTADLIRETLGTAQKTATMPLNGSQVLTAALAGGSGTVNDRHARDSAASLIRRGLAESSVQDGRNE